MKLNRCLADNRRWMITNKLKINDSKTEFIVFRSPQLKCDLSGLSTELVWILDFKQILLLLLLLLLFVSQCWQKYDYTIIKGDRFRSHIQPISQL